MANMDFVIHSVEEYLECIKKYRNHKNFFFRGQFREYSDLRCSLAREPGYIQNESSIYREAIDLKSDEFASLKIPIEKLAKMQHYGIPTRLIDFTADEKVALFFAVENIDESTDAVIYVYKQVLQPLDSKNVRLISLLASLDSYDLNNIAKHYFMTYREIISKEEILKYAQKNAFIKFTRKSSLDNKRLVTQKGAFLLCGNRVEKGQITDEINSFNLSPDMIIRIPFRYKNKIKRELNVKYKINKTSIYPELMSVAEYLKRKYSMPVEEENPGFHILKTDDISYDEAKRLVVSIAMDKKLEIFQIRDIAKKIINRYKERYDVIWVDVAENYDDYVNRDWIFVGLWTNPMLESIYWPMPLEHGDGRGYTWEIREDIPNVIYLPSNKDSESVNQLIEEADSVLEKLKPHYQKMLELVENESYGQLKKYGYNNGNVIFNCSVSLGNIGRSDNDNLNKFLDNYEYMAISMYDAVQIFYRDDLNERVYSSIINKYLKDASKYLKNIEEQKPSWISERS